MAGKQAEVQNEKETVVDWTLKLRGSMWKSKRSKKRGGLDVEAVGKQAEVQKEQESVVDWTSKLREAWQKSKRSKKAWWIGRQSCGEAGRSPKGASKRHKLDVEAAGGMAEVQKEQESVTDWTLKLRGSRLRSKRNKKPWRIGR